jgi:signal transduction histidine kinase
MRPGIPARPSPAQWLLLDGFAALAFGLFAFAVLGAREGNRVLALAATTLAAVTLPAARRRPLVAAAGALAVFWLSPVSPRYAWIALAPLVYALYRLAERHRFPVAAAALVAGLTAPVASALPAFRQTGGVLPFGLVLVVAWTAGVARRQRRLYGQALVRQAEQQAEQRAAQERARIARELHDVVAHGMSVITVQAAYGRLVLPAGAGPAADALAAIETTGRQSLFELRRLLGVLRAGDSAAAQDEPAPGLGDLARLAEETGRAGVRVELSVTGTPEALGPGLELSAYRIVQEALTNVVKHAGSGSAQVTIEHRPDALVLDIVDRGRGGEVGQEGHGLTGIRERAALYGGTVLAGPMPDGGFKVSTTLPRPAGGAS